MDLTGKTVEELRAMLNPAEAVVTLVAGDYEGMGWPTGEWMVTFAGGSFQFTWEDSFKTEQEALIFAIENWKEANS